MAEKERPAVEQKPADELRAPVGLEAPKVFQFNEELDQPGSGLFVPALDRVVSVGERLTDEEYEEAAKLVDNNGLHYIKKEA